MLIVFEGPGAVGKSTIIKELFKRLKLKGLNVRVEDEDNAVHDLILQFQEKNVLRCKLPPLTESFLWLTNYFYRIESQMHCKPNEIVLVDRYLFSPIIYQYIYLKEQGNQVNLKEVVDYVTKPFGIKLPKPDLYLILNTSLPIIKQRLEEREKRPMNDIEYKVSEQLIETYPKLQEFFDNFHIIDSSGTTKQTCEKIEEILDKQLFSKKGC
ncbi:MAG: deoxynucleoside kinase [archaeon]